jgi:Spy/CpxP family protein refolding chaperone
VRSTASALLLLVLSIPAAAAESPSPGDDPLARHLFPPERVMGHAQEIGLDDTQRTAIRKEVQKAQSKFLDLQFDIQTEMETMVRLVKENRVDEPKVLAQLDKVLALEKEIKKTQISLLVRIKNTLTPAQQARLSEMPREPGR